MTTGRDSPAGFIIGAGLACLISSLLSSLFFLHGADGQALDNIFISKIYGANVLSPNSIGDPDGYGVCTLDLSFEVDAIIWRVDVYKVSEPIGIFISSGTAQTPIATECPGGVNLLESGERQVKFISPQYGEYHISGAWPQNESSLLAVFQAPAEYFCLVQTTEYPNGALRGELQSGGGSGVAVSYANSALNVNPQIQDQIAP